MGTGPTYVSPNDLISRTPGVPGLSSPSPTPPRSGSSTAIVCIRGFGIGTSTSSMISTNCLVSAGTPLHCSAGDTLSPTPFPACFCGIAPPSVNAVLVMSIVVAPAYSGPTSGLRASPARNRRSNFPSTGMPGSLDAANSRNEATDIREVVAIRITVDRLQIRLFNDAHLKFDRGDEQHKSGDGHQIRCHQRDSEAERDHRGEDRIAHQTEHARADQRRRLAGVDADAPRVTHIELRIHRRGDADHRDRDARGLNPRRVQHAHR